MEIWGEKTTICIQVNPHYIYYAKIPKIGNPSDKPGVTSMWGWIHHLEEKNWWDENLKRSFMTIAFKMFE